MHLSINEKGIEKIILEYKLEKRQVEEAVIELIKSEIDAMMVRVLLQINQNLKNKDSSKKYDALYYLMLTSKEKYNQFIDSVDEKKDAIGNEEVEKILLGVRDILADCTLDMKEENDNPIEYERMVTISSGILRIKEDLLDRMERIDVGKNIKDTMDQDALVDYIQQQLLTFFVEAIPGIWNRIEASIEALSAHESAKPYLTYMMDQKHKLETLVLVQIEAIEVAQENESIIPLIEQQMDLLKEVYQKTLSMKERINEAKTTTIAAKDIFDYEDIPMVLRECSFDHQLEIDGILKKLARNQEGRLSELIELVDNDIQPSILELQERIKDENQKCVTLSDRLLVMFEATASELLSAVVDYQTEEGRLIGKGIVETMSLKAEVIRERVLVYKKNIESEVEQDTSMSHEFHRSIKSELAPIFVKMIGNPKRSVDHIINKCNQKVESAYGRHKKKAETYLRDDLLLELRTFNELVKYSVVKLDGYEEGCEIIVKGMYQLYEDTQKALEAFGIELIEPKPHDKFDGKCHEIMMVETLDAFRKGEIIRCHNVGYSLNKHVIARANVIAAK